MRTKSEKVPLQFCPECHKGLDGATLMSEGKRMRPSPGDISVCFFCATILRFDEKGVMVRATREDIGELEPMDALRLGAFVGELTKRIEKQNRKQ